jgi:hypothetical protein
MGKDSSNFNRIKFLFFSSRQANCACRNSPQWTRDCCGPTGGYFIYRKCYNTFGLSFIQCCRQAGLRGACVA